MTLRLGDHCGRRLARLAELDGRIWVLDGDLADSDGAVHFLQRHPERFVMAGIAEQTMVSVAAGMASCGLRPWVFSFAAFLCCRAYDQVRVSVCQARQPVALVGSHSGGCSGRNGKTHSVLNDIALMSTLPGMQVWSPAGPAEVHHVCRQVMASSAPAYVRLPRRPLDDLPGAPADWRWLAEPGRVALAATGMATHLAHEAWCRLRRLGLHAGLLHCLRVSPLPEGLAAALREVRLLIVVEDHGTTGGLAALLRELDLDCQIVSLGWPPGWPGESGADDDVLRRHGLTPEQIAATVAGLLRRAS